MPINEDDGMRSLNYSDYYRFRVSLGVALLSAAAIIPWLYLGSDFGVAMRQLEFEGLRPAAQRLVERKERFGETLSIVVPMLSIFLGIVGLSQIWDGLEAWKPRQQLRDEHSELELAELRHRVTPLPPNQAPERMQAELNQDAAALGENSAASGESEAEPADESSSPVTVSPSARAALHVERSLASSLEYCLTPSFDVMHHRGVEDLHIDIVAFARQRDEVDAVIEVKHIKKGFGMGWIRAVAGKLALMTEKYSGATGRSARGVLLVVAPRSVLLERSARDDVLHLVESRLPVRVVYLASEEIDGLGCEELRIRLGFRAAT